MRIQNDPIKIAIGSCHDNSRLPKNTSSLIFKSIAQWKPDVYLWLGDAVYLDRGDKRWSWTKMKTVNTEKSQEAKM